MNYCMVEDETIVNMIVCENEGLQEKMDVYLAADRLTPEEYSVLSEMLAAEAAE